MAEKNAIVKKTISETKSFSATVKEAGKNVQELNNHVSFSKMVGANLAANGITWAFKQLAHQWRDALQLESASSIVNCQFPPPRSGPYPLIPIPYPLVANIHCIFKPPKDNANGAIFFAKIDITGWRRQFDSCHWIVRHFYMPASQKVP